MKEKTCSKCGIKVKSYSYGSYCDTCANEVWDGGFSSTSQHAEELYEKETEDREKINRKLNKKDINYEEIKELTEHKSGRLRCAKCGHMRINTKYLSICIEKGIYIENLKKPCSKCGIKGFYIYENR